MRARAPHGRFARVAVWALVGCVGVPSVVRATSDVTCPDGAREAAVAAVREAFSAQADVTLTDVTCERAPSAGRVAAAVAEPASRTDGPVRFVLYAAGDPVRQRAGRLTAVVQVSAPHVRTAVPVAARTAIDPATLTTRIGPVGRVPFGSLVELGDLTHTRLRRSLPADAVLTTVVVQRAALVRSGGGVVTIARVHGVEVRGRAVAAQDGDIGDLVIVVNPDSRKRLRGRVVAEGLVEVIDVS